MVIYFSKNVSTRKYAKALSAIKNEPLFEIKQEKAIGGSVTSAIKSVMKKEEKILEIPDISNETVLYLCSPVWGGGFPPAMRYFVKHAALSNKNINLLLTCMTLSDSYVAEYEKQLNEVGAKLKKSIVFSSKKNPEPPLEKLSTF